MDVIRRARSHFRRLLAGDTGGGDAGGTVTLETPEDTHVESGSPDTNRATTNTLKARATSSYQENSLLRFDLSSLAGRTVTAATLHLFVGTQTSASGSLNLHRILDANDWVVGQATWNVRKTGTAWAGSAGCMTSGTDYDATPCNTNPVTVAGNAPAGTAADIEFDANGLADLQAMIDGTNQGLVLRSSRTFRTFYGASTEHATAAYHPTLEVTYT